MFIAAESGIPMGPTTTMVTIQESIGEKTADLARKMNMETWQLVAILVGKLKLYKKFRGISFSCSMNNMRYFGNRRSGGCPRHLFLLH